MVGCSLLLVFLVVAATAGYGYVHYRFGQISSVDVPGLHRSSSGRPFNLLVVGSDSRESLDDADGSRYGNVGGQRNDTTLVVRVEPARKRVSMLSIPRDLVVPIAGGGENRINAALTGGPGQLVKTVEQNFGIPIHHYVLIDFDGFRAIVDALGGIDVRFPYPSRDVKSGLDVSEAGCRHLSGGRALALARSRYFSYQLDGVWHSDPWADLGRIRRQQAFLQALVKAALDKGLTNPVRANAFVGSLVHEVTKDSALRVGDVIRTGAAFRSFRPSQLASYTLPVTVATDHPLGDVLLLKQPDAVGVVDRFLGRTPPAGPAPSATTQVSVLNALGTSGLAASTATELRRSGYRIATVGNAPSADLPRSQIAYAPGGLAAARTLAGTLLGGANLVEDPTLATSHLTLVLGPGFTGIRPTSGAPPTSGSPGGSDTRSDGYTKRGSAANGGSASAPAKPKPTKAVPDLRPYDPRPC